MTAFGVRRMLQGVRVLEAEHVARVLDDRALHPEADPEEGRPVLARPPDRADLALEAALAEAAGTRTPWTPASARGRRSRPRGSRRRPCAGPRPRRGRCPRGRGTRRSTCRRRGARRTCRRCRSRPSGRWRRMRLSIASQSPKGVSSTKGRPRRLHHEAVEALVDQVEGDLVDREVHVLLLDDAVLAHVAEEGDLLVHPLLHGHLGAADEDVGLDADLAQLAHGVLGGLGLHLARARR